MIAGFVRRLAGVKRRAVEYNPASSPLRSLAPSVAGPAVSVDSAMRNMAVLRCVAIIAQTLASMPLIVYKRTGTSRRRAGEHPLSPVLAQVGNAEMTAFEVRETRLAHTLTYGNAFSQIQYDSNYQVRGLLPMVPDRVGIERLENGKLLYTYWDERTHTGYTLPAYRVMHTRFMVWSGVWGLSPIRQAMNALGVAAAAEEFGGRYFANGSRPSVILKYPGRLTKEAYERLRYSFQANWEGLENAHRINILEEGITPEQIGVPPDEAQFLETRQYQVQEIARLYGVPLHMLAVGETATYASSEQDAINFRQTTILPWARRDENRLLADLLTAAERDAGYYIEYLLDGIERATVETRSAAYGVMIQNGIMMPNEARARENLDPLPGGDVLLLPLNMQQVRPDGTVVQPPPPESATPDEEPDPEDDDQPEEEPEDQPESGIGADGETDDRAAALLEQAGLAADLTNAWIADVRQRLESRIANDVRQQGGKAMRNGGRAALGEWGESMIVEWRSAGEGMLEKLRSVRPAAEPNVGEWVATAYQRAVRGLVSDGAD